MLSKINKSVEEKLNRVTEEREGSSDNILREQPKGNELLVLGDSIVTNVAADCPDLKTGYFPDIRADQLQRVIEKRDFGTPDTIITHVGTNDIKISKNLDYVMEDIYELINTAKTKFASSRAILSGVLRRRGVSWRRIGAKNDRLEWVANSRGVSIVEPTNCVDDRGFGGDGLHLNRRGTQQLGQLFMRVIGAGDKRQVNRGT
jgi:lysophospholipase L1-like esterase